MITMRMFSITDMKANRCSTDRQPQEMFKIFEESDEDAQELAKKIKGVL
jgi:hypothetical protein